MPPIVLIYLARPKQVFGAQGGVELQKAVSVSESLAIPERGRIAPFVCLLFFLYYLLASTSYT